MIQSIIKRDGRVVLYDQNKIAAAILKALEASHEGDAADAEKILANAEHARGEKLRPDVVILDPPRKGCDSALLSFVASLSPRTIVYVSCNPDTLARDVALLAPLGYTSDRVQPVDLFPRTPHVETVALLKQTDSTTKFA